MDHLRTAFSVFFFLRRISHFYYINSRHTFFYKENELALLKETKGFTLIKFEIHK